MKKDEFDFGQFFNTGSNDSQKAAQGGAGRNPMDMVAELLKDVTQNYKPSELTLDEVKQAFRNRYGSDEEFLMKHFQKMTEPYEDAIMKAAMDRAKEAGQVFGSVMTAAAIDAARNFNNHMLEANLQLHGKDLDSVTMKTAILSATLHKIMPKGNPEDSMIAINAMLAIIGILTAELTANLIAQEMAKSGF